MERTERPGLTRTAAAVLIAGPLLMALGRLLLVPLNDQGWDQQLTQAAAHQGRSDTGWLIAMASSGLIAAGALSLASVLRRAGRANAAAFTVVATAVGWAGSAGIATAGLLLSYQGQAPDRAVQVQLLKDVNAGHTAFIFLLCVVAAVGYVVLSVGLARTQVVSKGVAVALAVGGAGTLLTGPGPAKPLLVLAALVLLVAQGLVVRGIGVDMTVAPEPAWEPVTA